MGSTVKARTFAILETRCVGTLYKLDFTNGKSYIGITTRTMKARFAQHQRAVGSAKPNGPALYSAWRKHGAPALTVLAILEDEDLFETEKRAIAVFGTLSPGGYNLTEGGDAGGSKHPEVRAKISAANRGKTKPLFSAEHRAKLSAANTGKTLTAEHRAKMAVAQRARPPASVETRAKIGEAHRGKTVSDATRAKLSAAAAGKSPSAETRATLSAALRGRRQSLEHIAKRSASRARPPQ